MGNKIIIMILATFAMMASAFADNHEEGTSTEKKPFAIYGDFAGSVFFAGNDDSAAGSVASRHDDFLIDLAELNIEKNWSHSKLHLSIGYGDTAAAVNSIANPTVIAPATAAAVKSTLNLMNANYSMTSSYGLGFMFGKFESPMGYESFNHMDNTLYSRSYGYTSLIPQFTTGIGLTYAIHPMIDAAFYVVNGSDNANPDTNANKTMILTVGINPMDALSIDIKYMAGVDNVGGAGADVNATVTEVTAAFTVNEMINLALDYTAKGTETRGATATKVDASSIAAYVNGNFGMFGAALRYEMLADDKAGMVFKGVDVTKDNTVSAITVGIHTEIDQNARVILEYRTESADEKVWNDKDGVATDSKSMTTLGLMYRF